DGGLHDPEVAPEFVATLWYGGEAGQNHGVDLPWIGLRRDLERLDAQPFHHRRFQLPCLGTPPEEGSEAGGGAHGPLHPLPPEEPTAYRFHESEGPYQVLGVGRQPVAQGRGVAR